jgi:D-serine deaminase-like pyridoxal phosphate-dependent protein
VRLRPHAKTHKSAVIARQQIERGAVGQCVQKVSEAEALVWAGVTDVLVSNEVVGHAKLARLAALANIARISVCADSALQVKALEAAAASAEVRLEVLVEIDAGGHRCGAEPGSQAVDLAKQIAASPWLDFGGLQAYHGGAQHLRTPDERRQAIEYASNAARTTADLLLEEGIECRTIAGAGTGTFVNEVESGIYNELQLGSYIFMDADYARNLDETGAPVSLFQQSLFVLTTVMSAPRPGVAVVDAGHKAAPTDSGLPLVWQRPGVEYIDASDEHGALKIAEGTQPLKEGQKIRLVPAHCDPTVDRYDWYVCVRNGKVECLWPITARGAMT